MFDSQLQVSTDSEGDGHTILLFFLTGLAAASAPPALPSEALLLISPRTLLRGRSCIE